MRKGKTVIGQDVFSLSDGLRVQSVKDLVVNDRHDAIVALLVDEGGLLSSSTIVPIESVHRFGPDAVMVETASAVIPAASDARVAAILDKKVSLLGTPVVTTAGERIGKIGDLYFNESSGVIEGYEVSGGALGDAITGTSWLPLTAIQVIGPDVVIAEPEAADIVAEQIGGIQGAVAQARDAVSTAVASGDSDDAASADAAPKVERDPDQDLVGRRAAADATDSSGSVVLANGQRVTLDHVQRARAEGWLDALYTSVGLERPVPVTEQLSGAVQTATETAGDLWGRFTSKLSEMTDSAGKRVDTQQSKGQLDRIHDAIGRPVTKVFLDREDSVILDLGDLVTHQAVQRAYDAGMLESLLSSIYTGEVSFTRDEMKAPVAGDSTIEQATGGATMMVELEERIAAAQAPAEPAEDTRSEADTESKAEDTESDADTEPVADPVLDTDLADDAQPVADEQREAVPA